MTKKDESVYRQEKIVEILNFIHQGGDFETAKTMFNETFEHVDVAEITMLNANSLLMVLIHKKFKISVMFMLRFLKGRFLMIPKRLLLKSQATQWRL